VADPRAPRFPFVLLFFFMALSALIGGVVARMLPVGSDETAVPRVLAGPPEDSLAPLVRKTAPAVVSISTLLPSPAEQNPLLQDPFFRRYFGVPDAALQPAMAAGSGVIVDGKRGFVITNFHVVRNATAVEVTLKDGRKYRAEPLGVAPELDLAVLRIGAKATVASSRSAIMWSPSAIRSAWVRRSPAVSSAPPTVRWGRAIRGASSRPTRRSIPAIPAARSSTFTAS
jgi:S1-C subfamily serine protease